METPIIEAKNIHKRFFPALSFSDIAQIKFFNPKPQTALIDVSFSLMPQKLLVILGENGAGKTTLLNILASLILPDSGSIKIKNLDLTLHELELKAQIGFMSSEERSFYWRLSGRQNLEFFAVLYGLKAHQAKKRIDYLINKFNITYADKRYSDFSTGMKKIFSLLRTFIHDPQILLLDEPLKSLDLSKKEILIEMIKSLKAEGKTIIISTHNFELANLLADEFLLLHNGAVRGQGSIQDLHNKFSAPHASLQALYIKATENV